MQPPARLLWGPASGNFRPMQTPSALPERLFPFALRARLLVVGREALHHMRRKLAFVLVAETVRPESLAEIRADYADLPVVKRYTPEDFERWFSVPGAKVLGFRKSSLSNSLLRELKEFRLPPVAPKPDQGQAKPTGEPPPATADTPPGDPAEAEPPPSEAPAAELASESPTAAKASQPVPPPRPWRGASKRPERPAERPPRPWRGEQFPRPDRRERFRNTGPESDARGDGRPPRPYRQREDGSRPNRFGDRPPRRPREDGDRQGRPWGPPSWKARGESPFRPRPWDRARGAEGGEGATERPRPWGKRPYPPRPRGEWDRPKFPRPPFAGPRSEVRSSSRDSEGPSHRA